MRKRSLLRDETLRVGGEPLLRGQLVFDDDQAARARKCGELLADCPGPPFVVTTVDVVTSYDAGGNPATFDEDVPAQGAINVFRLSPIRFLFNDVMNPGTLVNPVTGQSAPSPESS